MHKINGLVNNAIQCILDFEFEAKRDIKNIL